MSARPRLTPTERDEIVALLRPVVVTLMRRFDIAPSTVGRLAAIAGRKG